jgi:hypothetical protein
VVQQRRKSGLLVSAGGFVNSRDRCRKESPMPASWNQIAGWLKQIDSLRQAA